jgi:hypothetical protein
MAAKNKVSRPGHTPPKQAEEEKSKGRTKRGGFDNTDRGALFENDKDGNENRPDLTGTVDLKIPEGAKPGEVIKFRIAAWQKESQAGNPYYSLKIQKADKQGSNREE